MVTTVNDVAAHEPIVFEYIIVSVPALTPLTTPELFIIAMLVFLLLHAPPDIVSLNVSVELLHSIVLPLIAPADGVLVTVITTLATADPQERLILYFIVSVPGVTPVTMPVLLTVATPVFVLLQVPPVPVSLSVAVLPAHKTLVPVIAGTPATFTVSVALQPSIAVTLTV
jgi:hypothetical protein